MGTKPPPVLTRAITVSLPGAHAVPASPVVGVSVVPPVPSPPPQPAPASASAHPSAVSCPNRFARMPFPFSERGAPAPQ